MATIAASELSKILYLDTQALDGRALMMMPFWDGKEWHMWIEAPPGSLTKIRPVDAIHSSYIAKRPAIENDIWIEFIDCMWQRANWSDISHIISGIEDDFHLLATSAAKLRHFFLSREKIDEGLVGVFVKSELEYIITVARSVFDLLQEGLAAVWNKRFTLIDPIKEATKKRHKLPNKFTKMVLIERGTPREIEEMSSKYAIPAALSEQYNRYARFYVSLLRSRDKIIHGGGSIDSIFVTEKGFCVDPTSKMFISFPWKKEHFYNENIVSLLPWVAHIVCWTIQACNDITSAFFSTIAMPPKIAPDYRIFIRAPANEALHQLSDVFHGQNTWWTDDLREMSDAQAANDDL